MLGTWSELRLSVGLNSRFHLSFLRMPIGQNESRRLPLEGNELLLLINWCKANEETRMEDPDLWEMMSRNGCSSKFPGSITDNCVVC